MKERTLVSAITLAASLASYFYAKQTNKDIAPCVMVGGFLGAMLGEYITQVMKKENENKDQDDKDNF